MRNKALVLKILGTVTRNELNSVFATRMQKKLKPILLQKKILVSLHKN